MPSVIPFSKPRRDDTSNIDPTSLPMPKTRVLALLVVFSLVILIPRLVSYEEPLMCDVANYALVGHEWSRGQRLYADVMDNKPPLLYLTFALGEGLFGYGQAQCFGLGLLAALLTMIAIFRTGRWWRNRAEDGLWAAAFWAWVSSDGLLDANKPMAEAFIALFLAWGFYFALPDEKRQPRWIPWTLAGVCFSLATLYKHNAGWVPLSISAAYALLYLRDRAPFLAAKTSACLIAPSVLAWGVLILYAKATGLWPDMKTLLFTVNFAYGGSIPHNLLTGLAQWHPKAAFLLPALGLTLIAIVLGWRRAGKPMWVLTGFLVGIYLATFSYSYQRSYYYQPWLPLLSVGIGWFWGSIRQTASRSAHRWALAILATLFLFLAVREIPWWFKSAEAWSFSKYETSFLIDRPIAADLLRILEPSETFYVFSYHSGLYLLTGQSPPSGVLVEFFLRDGPLQAVFAQRVQADLSKHNNEVIVCWNHFEPEEWETNPFILWMRDHYRPLAQDPHPGSMVFLVRKGGRLDRVYPAPASGYGPGPGWANPSPRE